MWEVWSFGINNKALCNNLKIVKIQFVVGLKELGLGVLNKKMYWETDEKTLKTWKVRFKKLLIE